MPIAAATAIDQCAVGVDTRLFTSLVRQESNFNPYAIGLDGKAVLKPQPRNAEEAIKTAVNLVREGKRFSVGLAQVHVSNVMRFGMTWEQAFDPCTNLRVASSILRSFYSQAVKAGYRDQGATFAALRGFNSGSVHNPISNGYARDILGRLGPMPPGVASTALPPLEAVAPAPVLPQGVDRASRPPRDDPSSPSMFSTSSPSLFGDDGIQPRAFPAPEPPELTRVADAGNARGSGPVLLRGTLSR